MLNPRGLGRLGLIALGLAWLGCYDMTTLRLAVDSPPSALDCAETADRVFKDAAFERVGHVLGPDLFYTPRTTTELGLHWGIGVWLKGGASARDDGRCQFELEALGGDLGCGMQCAYSSQRGAEYDRTLKDLAGRLALAVGATGRPAQVPNHQ